MSDMKLIMESWRGYVEKNKDLECSVHVLNEKKVLVETVNLSTLTEQADRGLITEEKLMEMWFDSAEYKWQQLINEGVIDVLKKGWQAVKKGAEFVGGKAIAAWEWATTKFRNFWIETYVRGIDLVQRVVGKVKGLPVVKQFIGGMKKMIAKAKDFRENHPVLFKVMLVTVAVAACLALSLAASSDAEASIKLGNKAAETGAEDIWQGTKGVCAAGLEMAQAPEEKELFNQCIQVINDYSPGGIYQDQTLQIGELNDQLRNVVLKSQATFNVMSKEAARSFNEEVKPLLDAWKAAGQPTDTDQYYELSRALDSVRDAREATGDLIEMGKQSTMKVKQIITTVDNSFTSIDIGGTIGHSAQPGIDQPQHVKAAGDVLRRGVQGAWGK